jgi:ribosomal protein S27AE
VCPALARSPGTTMVSSSHKQLAWSRPSECAAKPVTRVRDTLNATCATCAIAVFAGTAGKWICSAGGIVVAATSGAKHQTPATAAPLATAAITATRQTAFLPATRRGARIPGVAARALRRLRQLHQGAAVVRALSIRGMSKGKTNEKMRLRALAMAMLGAYTSDARCTAHLTKHSNASIEYPRGRRSELSDDEGVLSSSQKTGQFLHHASPCNYGQRSTRGYQCPRCGCQFYAQTAPRVRCPRCSFIVTASSTVGHGAGGMSREHAKLQTLTAAMVGTHSGHALGTWGAETNGQLFFTRWRLSKYQHKLPEDRSIHLTRGVSSLVSIHESIKAWRKGVPPLEEIQAFADNWKLHMHALRALDIQPKPKHHQ